MRKSLVFTTMLIISGVFYATTLLPDNILSPHHLSRRGGGIRRTSLVAYLDDMAKGEPAGTPLLG